MEHSRDHKEREWGGYRKREKIKKKGKEDAERRRVKGRQI